MPGIIHRVGCALKYARNLHPNTYLYRCEGAKASVQWRVGKHHPMGEGMLLRPPEGERERERERKREREKERKREREKERETHTRDLVTMELDDRRLAHTQSFSSRVAWRHGNMATRCISGSVPQFYSTFVNQTNTETSRKIEQEAEEDTLLGE